MTAITYSRERIVSVLAKTRLPLSYRIMPRSYLAAPLGTAPGDSRFCARADGYTVLYASPEFATAFIETIVRDRFAHRRHREVSVKEVTGRAWTLFASKPRIKLSLLDLRGDGCVRLGAPTDAVNARNHAAGRALGRTIHVEHEDIDGLLFSSRLTGADVYAVFDRAIKGLAPSDSGMLAEHPELPDLLARHKIRLAISGQPPLLRQR